MSASKHLWEALRDFLGVGESNAAAEAQAEQRTRLTAANDALAAASASLAQAEQRLDAAERAHTEALRGAVDTDPGRAPEPRATARGRATACAAAVAAARRQVAVLEARHAALARTRDALLRDMRDHVTRPAGERAAPPAKQPPGPAPFVVENDGDGAAGTDADLQMALERLRDTHVAALAERCLAQLEACRTQHKTFLTLLSRRLNPTELTFSRYAQAAARVCDGVLAQLRDSLDALELLATLDGDAVTAQLAELDAASGAPSSEARRLALTDRLALRDAQLARVERLLVRNDAALTTLLRSAAAVAEMPALDTAASDASFEQLLQDLQQLADRASVYR